MATEDIIRRGAEAVNRHDAAAFASLYAPDAIVIDPQYPEPLRGHKAIAKDIAEFFDAFPDLEVKTSGVLAQGNTYAFEIIVTGAHKGPLLGPNGPIPATNRRMSIRGAVFGRLDARGRIAEEHRHYDMAGLPAQLGLMP